MGHLLILNLISFIMSLFSNVHVSPKFAAAGVTICCTIGAKAQGIQTFTSNAKQNMEIRQNTSTTVLAEYTPSKFNMNLDSAMFKKYDSTRSNGSVAGNSGLAWMDTKGLLQTTRFTDVRWNMTNTNGLTASLNNKINWSDTVNAGPIMTQSKASAAIDQIMDSIEEKADVASVYTKSAADGRFYPLASNPENYLTSASVSGKVNYTDTAAMLSPYLRKIDTTGKWQPAGSYATTTQLNGKVNISDTAAMLSPYLRSAVAAATYATITAVNGKVSISDTANMLSPYLRKLDTASLSNRINLKQNALNLTTTGTGAATLLGSTLNIPTPAAVDTTPIHNQITQLTTAVGNNTSAITGKQNLVNLTTTGSGAATFNQSTGALNIPTPSATDSTKFYTVYRSDTSRANLYAAINGKGIGSVTSVAATGGTGISVSGSPITGSGTFTITNTAPDQTVTITGAGTNTVTGTYPNYTITGTSPAANNNTGYLTGTAYTTTTTYAKVTGGTTSPSVTLPATGTYLLLSNLTIDYVGLTTLSLTACNFKLRKTSGTASDIPNTSSTFNVPVVTLLTSTGGDADPPAAIYSGTAGDVIELWAQRGASVTVGSIQVTNGFLMAIKMY